jgi:hypothetical protein
MEQVLVKVFTTDIQDRPTPVEVAVPADIQVL